MGKGGNEMTTLTHGRLAGTFSGEPKYEHEDQAEMMQSIRELEADGWHNAAMGRMIRGDETVYLTIRGLSAACRTLYRASNNPTGSN